MEIYILVAFTVAKYHKYQPAVNTDLTQKSMLGKTQLEVIPVCMHQLLKDAFSSVTAWIITLEQLEQAFVFLYYQSTSLNIKLLESHFTVLYTSESFSINEAEAMHRQ